MLKKYFEKAECERKKKKKKDNQEEWWQNLEEHKRSKIESMLGTHSSHEKPSQSDTIFGW